MIDEAQVLAVTLFSEILTADQLLRNRLSRILPTVWKSRISRC